VNLSKRVSRCSQGFALKGLCDNFNFGTGIETVLDGIAIETGQETCLATFTTCADPILTKLSVCTNTDCQCPLIEIFNGECVPSETCEGVNTDQTDAFKDVCANFNIGTDIETVQDGTGIETGKPDTCLATFTTSANSTLTELSECTDLDATKNFLCQCPLVDKFNADCVPAVTCEGVNTDQTDALKDVCANFSAGTGIVGGGTFVIVVSLLVLFVLI
jgi:hypothetical protein